MTEEDKKGFIEAEEKLTTFLEARAKAEKEGQIHFTCPLCGGDAWWGRARLNNHLRSKCRGCGFSIMS